MKSCILALTALTVFSTVLRAQVQIAVNPARTRLVINPMIYGRFIEHLGGCIHDGIWVGESSKIPNDRGLRLDTIKAPRKVRVPGQSTATATRTPRSR